MMHGANAAVSAASNGGNGPSTLQKQHRYSSRSNSVSGSSASTVKQHESLSSSSAGARNSILPMRAQNLSDTSLIGIRAGESQVSQEHKRQKSLAVDLSEQQAGGGLANIQRWSHSTNSSVVSVGTTRRSRASSGAVLPSIAAQQLSLPGKVDRSTLNESPRASPQRKPLSSRASSQRRRYSPTPSPDRARRIPSQHNALAASLTALPSLNTTPALVDANDTDSPSTLQTNTPSTSGLATPSTHSSYVQDYFGAENVSPKSTKKSKRPVMARNNTTPMSELTHSRMPGPESSEQSQGSAHKPRQSSFLDSFEHGSRPSTATHERERKSHRRESSSQRRPRTRERGEQDKKAMLAKALQKANTAVLLDNAQNFEVALEAYSDACRLLQQVMDRSSGADDKRKLEDIKVTYTNRIEELRQLEETRPSTADEKSLPMRPMSNESMTFNQATTPVSPIEAYVRNSAVFDTATMTKIPDLPRLAPPMEDRDSFLSRTIADVERAGRSDPDLSNGSMSTEIAQQKGPREKQAEEVEEAPQIKQQTLSLPSPDDNKYMPAPLSSRRPLPPAVKPAAEPAGQQPLSENEQLEHKQYLRSRANSHASMSWLDTIDESTSSCGSSIHSRTSHEGLRRKNLRDASGESGPDFDAAFDAAVEAAYNEGLEPDLEARKQHDTLHGHAKTEFGVLLRPAAFNGHTRSDSTLVPISDIKEWASPTNEFHPAGSLNATSSLDMDIDDEEEERLLDEIANDYASGFHFDLGTKSALPRQSDSSGYSRSTWQSSQLSDRTTAGTSLSTVAEDVLLPGRLSQKPTGTPSSINTVRAEPPPPPPPPSVPPPTTSLPRPPSMSASPSSTVRSRRLSGQNPKQLKIETASASRKRASTFHHSASPYADENEQMPLFDIETSFGVKLEPTRSDSQHEHILQSPPSLNLRSATSQASIAATTTTTSTSDRRMSLDEAPGELRSARPNFFRKNKSSLSLREHTGLLFSPDNSEASMMTPMSSTFAAFKPRHGHNPLTSHQGDLPTIAGGSLEGQHSGGAYLFDTSLSAAQPPRSPRSPGWRSQHPVGLEPCPESFLLRPFWLMRAIGATLIHQRGAFLTTRLFVPRDVWQTRGVKLKAIDDKIANCDLLTAALGRLAGVDTCDADAVMVELQSFEEVMERVQAGLVKKLGSDIGVHGVSALFKDAAAASTASGAANAQGADTAPGAERTSKGKEGKGYLNSWRKLRSKSSGTPLATPYVGKPADKEMPTMSSVPMTSFVPVERRGHKKDIRNLAFEGPNREYMGSLARLFEAAQVLDQIARQVEDPGLKHSSPTHVGLELSIRHAAEFFGFYVCRFVLADLGTLLDKFVKRGTEWVLA